MLTDFLFKQRDGRQLAFLRMLIGGWYLVDMLSMLVSGYVKEAYVTPRLNFPFYGFEWISPLPGYGMYLLFVLLCLLSAGIMTGYRFRLCLGLFLVGWTYVFMCDIVYTLNKFYMFILLGLMLFTTQADRFLSLRPGATRTGRTDAWQIIMFQVFLGMIYLLSGFSKLNPDWILHAEPLRYFYKHRIPMKYLPDDVFLVVAYAFSWCGMVFDLGIIWLLRWQKTRFVANILQAMFHLLNFFILFIGTFSLASLAVTWLLFPTKWLKRKLKFDTESLPAISRKPAYYQRVIILLAIFFALNFAVPFRGFFTGNNVNWTEKGHRFSWRLMTRSKSGSQASFTVVDNRTGKRVNINPRQLLTRRQYRKMSGETDLVIYMAHWLEQEYAKDFGHTDVSVYSNIRTQLNGRPRTLLIDPALDLTTVSRSFLIDEVSTEMPERRKKPTEIR